MCANGIEEQILKGKHLRCTFFIIIFPLNCQGSCRSSVLEFQMLFKDISITSMYATLWNQKHNMVSRFYTRFYITFFLLLLFSVIFEFPYMHTCNFHPYQFKLLCLFRIGKVLDQKQKLSTDRNNKGNGKIES